ncbi:unnamed protein product [Diatraea saccharalis]|uniref:Shuttle craft n=1 Tax=Diatraea saccharalis TaxID=40085 RepID=A0A9N9QZC8_9NEOP|nr:unnamed protein product [Diatraea saccharalis]
MSQWNSSYVYDNQYQGTDSWNGDLNSQYVNQAYYPNQQYEQSNQQYEQSNQQYEPSNQQYVSFNEFLSQMQSNGIPSTSSNGYNSAQYQNYSQHDYQNMPTTSQNTQVDNYYKTNPSNSSNGAQSSTHNKLESKVYNGSNSNTYTNDIILKSNLTPTANEFVPKGSGSKPSTSNKNNPETLKSNNGASNNVTEQKAQSSRGSSSDTNWRERPQALQQNGESSYKNENSSRSHDNYKYTDSNSRRRDSKNRYQESNNYDSNSRNNRNQSKAKSKNRDGDARTFYNSAVDKNNHEYRNSRGETSNRNRNWAGSQRVRASERDVVEDEQYASSYLNYRDEKVDKVARQDKVSSPKPRGKQTENVYTEMTQRERLSEQLDKGTLECLVCCERVKQIDPVWSCSNCYHVLHLRCIRKWAMSSVVEGKWRCPACQNTSEEIPMDYRCMCGYVRSPEYQRGNSGAHTCGKACRRPRTCPHPCTLLCHPGPCPPCQATITKHCGCGAESRSVMCSSKLPQVCGRVCNRLLDCGVHTCQKECHEGTCEDCTENVTQVCYCPAAQSRSVPCTRETGLDKQWSCGEACSRVLSCGHHVCRSTCHPPPCPPCQMLPNLVPTCPCGKTKLPEGSRKACTDPIPLCGNICAKPLPCGPPGDRHFCKQDCHEGACPVCPDKTLVQCRCGHSSREVPCSELPQTYNNIFCQKKCNKKLSCGRHRCRTSCCAASSHRCAVVCGRTLSCQTHRCEEFCHTGHCAPCPRLGFVEVRCACGEQALLPPVPCGARPPACSADCRVRRPCRHPPHHACHQGDCPPCVVLTTKRCHGGHEERKTIPCSQDEFSCGLPCGKPLPCGKHTCIKTCHKGPCDTGKCTQPCVEKRPSCGHPCSAPCHSSSGAACPSAAACRRPVRATCPCGRRALDRPCQDNARDLAKIISAIAATKIQENGTVDLSEVQRPVNMLKTLECDDECRVEQRTRQMALALQIRNPDVSSKLAPRYSDGLRATATKEPAFAQQVHDKLTELVHLAKKSKQKTRSHSFPSMNWQKRQFIHELCEHFGCESVAYDAEPNRNVVATADREKSWLPAMSILEVVSREAGKRRVPGPVLRPPAANAPASSAAATTTTKSGWATLTSTNAWAARQSAPATASVTASASAPASTHPPVEKIDYFDNPPDN